MYGMSRCAYMCGQSKLSTMAVGRQLVSDVTGNSAIFSAENSTLELNMKCIGVSVAEIRSFAYLCGIWTAHFGGSRGRRGSVMAPLERTIVVCYRLSIVAVALSVTNLPQSAIECVRRSSQRGVRGALWGKTSRCSPYIRPVVFGSAESEYLRRTIGEIIVEEF